MRVEFLDADGTTALLTRGFWKWKRAALVHRISYHDWKYDTGGNFLSQVTNLETRRDLYLFRQKESKAWRPVEMPPKAWVLK